MYNFLLFTIYVDVHDVTLSRKVFLSQLFKGVHGGAVAILQRTSRPHVGCPQSLTQATYFSLYFSLYPNHFLSRTCEILTTYNLPFSYIMDLAQKFERVACDKTISVTEMDPDHILRSKRLNHIRSQCVAHYPGLNGGSNSGLLA